MPWLTHWELPICNTSPTWVWGFLGSPLNTMYVPGTVSTNKIGRPVMHCISFHSLTKKSLPENMCFPTGILSSNLLDTFNQYFIHIKPYYYSAKPSVWNNGMKKCINWRLIFQALQSTCKWQNQMMDQTDVLHTSHCIHCPHWEMVSVVRVL